MNSHGGAAEQVGLDADHVLVAAAAVQDSLDADFLLDLDRGHDGGDAGTGARAVRDVDDVESGLGADFRLGDGGVEQVALRRDDLDRVHPLAGGEFSGEGAFFGGGNGIQERDGRFGRRDLDHVGVFRERTHAARHVGDVLGRGAAAAADAAHAELGEAHGVGGEILRTAHVEHAVVHAARTARVGLGDHGELFVDERQDGLERAEHRAGTAAAVEAERDRLDRGRGDVLQNGGDRFAFGRLRVFIQRETEHERHAVRGRRGGLQREVEVGETGERLEHQKIGRGLCEHGDLFGEDVERIEVRREFADGADGRGNHGVVARHLARELDSGLVDCGGLFGEAELHELGAVRAVGIGREDLGSGVEVRRVDGADHVGPREAEVFERDVDEEVPPVYFGAHRAVEDHDAVVQGIL